jgi:hypothetical protein
MTDGPSDTEKHPNYNIGDQQFFSIPIIAPSDISVKDK